jgi:signal transduction histidine kinase
VRLAASATRSGGSALWLQTPSGPRLEATHGPAGQREAIGRALQTAAHAVMEEARPSLVERSLHDPNLTPEAAAQLEGYTMVPLLAYGRVLGALAVYDRAGSGMRRDGRLPDFEFLASLGDQLALALDQSSRFDALRDAERKLEEQRTWIGRLERLARVGEGTLEALQAARHPVASIRSFARRLQKSMPADDPRRDALDVVLRESERLDALLESKLDGARKESDSLRLESLNASLQEVLQEFGESLVRRRIRLLKRLAPDLPTLLVDGERVRLVMRNILRHALDDVPVGGRVRIESRRVDRHVVVDVAHDGVRRPGDLIERLFSPFALAGDGAETALAIAHRVVRQHGGEIRFRTEADWNSIVSFTLPIAGNEERRQENERRSRRRDRRTGPAARHGNDSRGASGDAPRG